MPSSFGSVSVENLPRDDPIKVLMLVILYGVVTIYSGVQWWAHGNAEDRLKKEYPGIKDMLSIPSDERRKFAADQGLPHLSNLVAFFIGIAMSVAVTVL